ncbi:MAG: PIN domain-containing protein [Acidobacteria bacterium]|nr:PIN domain-containing protein [Acidobacteriota bacterium]
MRIYLDACCLSRLTDDQSQARIREEAEAVEKILAGVRRSTLELISSEALEDEVRRNPSLERRVEAETLLSLAVTRIEIDDATILRARHVVRLGYGPLDALHVAAAEAAGADVMLTTDDRLLKRTASKTGNPRVSVQNPLSWIKEQGV